MFHLRESRPSRVNSARPADQSPRKWVSSSATSFRDSHRAAVDRPGGVPGRQVQQRHGELLRGRPVLARHRPRRQHQPRHGQHRQGGSEPLLGCRRRSGRTTGTAAARPCRAGSSPPRDRACPCARRGARRRPTATPSGHPGSARTASEITSEVSGSASSDGGSSILTTSIASSLRSWAASTCASPNASSSG